MTRSLAVAILGALLGFGGWIWLTGPGTSVLNALIALLCGLGCGRAAGWIAARILPDAEPPPPVAPPAPKGRRAPPPADPEPWREPAGRN